LSTTLLGHVGSSRRENEYAAALADGAVKKRVGASAANIDDYGQGKNAVIQKVAAGLTHVERASIGGNRVPPTGTSPIDASPAA